jgi:hypothetical protein
MFIGSGVPAWSGLPSGQQLLQQMLQFLEEHGLPPDEERRLKVSSSYLFMLRK